MRAHFIAVGVALVREVPPGSWVFGVKCVRGRGGQRSTVVSHLYSNFFCLCSILHDASLESNIPQSTSIDVIGNLAPRPGGVGMLWAARVGGVGIMDSAASF